ncbi:hypothetical protein F5884DRAFT_730846 [Xylogone sp. PMI_703]|nr:hypothetical protein F5884DRAFT_730846 [Xylogone sp. PMI_703]
MSLSITYLSLFVALASGSASPTCKNIPGDEGWPSPAAWDALNATVGGRLIATVPAAHVCHDPTFSSAECASLAQQWDDPVALIPVPGEILSPWWQNQSCIPFTPESTPCKLGSYASYSINVTGVDDILQGLTFAKQNNIRLVIKNTGHDFYGKSTGTGALALWTHNLKNLELIPTYEASYYSGPALRLGAGVQGGDALDFAAANGYRVVVGDCPTVGVAGGYTQGGGHSPLMGVYGLGADNVLEWEVVTAAEEHIVATPVQNTDLYWALSGGGGGTYGVVVSMTTRLFSDSQTAGATLGFNASALGGLDQYWNAVGIFLSQLQDLVEDSGVVTTVIIEYDLLEVVAVMAPGRTDSELEILMQPLISAMAQAGVSSSLLNVAVTSSSNSYAEVYNATVRPFFAHSLLSPVQGGRFVSRDNLANNLSGVVAALRAATDGGKFYLATTAVNTQGSGRIAAPVSSNSIQPSWGGAFLSIIIGAFWTFGQPWENAIVLQDELTNVIMPTLEAATPGADAYMNEGNFHQPDWQDVFYGVNYERLRAIKTANDPDDFFYGLTAVGSEAWAADADGRLCRTGL